MRVRTQSQNSGKDAAQDISFSGRIISTIKSKIGDAAKYMMRSQSAANTTDLMDNNAIGEAATSKKLAASQSETDFQTFNGAKPYEKPSPMGKSSANAKTFLYEPPLASSRTIRAWENDTGRKYYDLSPSSRREINQALKGQSTVLMNTVNLQN